MIKIGKLDCWLSQAVFSENLVKVVFSSWRRER